MNRGSPSGWPRPRRILPRSFNEAPIHESGKFFGQNPGWQMSDNASMRPRFMNRGSTATLDVSMGASPLQ